MRQFYRVQELLPVQGVTAQHIRFRQGHEGQESGARRLITDGGEAAGTERWITLFIQMQRQGMVPDQRAAGFPRFKRFRSARQTEPRPKERPGHTRPDTAVIGRHDAPALHPGAADLADIMQERCQ